MKLQRVISVEVDESTVRGRIEVFLERSGYKQMGSQPSLLYQRGSKLGSLASFSPKGWRVNAAIQTMPVSEQTTQVSITLNVDTTGQWVTEKENSFWKGELDALEASVRSGNTDVSVNDSLAQSSLLQNVYACAVIIGSAVVVAVGARLLFPIRLVFWGGWIIGALIGLVVVWRWLKVKRGDRT